MTKMLIKIQIAYLYLSASIGKLKVEEWIDGTAIYYWINHNVFGVPHWLKIVFNYFFQSKFILSFTTFLILILELFLSFGLFARNSIKLKLFYFGLFLHFMIFILLGLPTFMLAMYSGLILYLLDLEKLIQLSIWKK